MDRETSDQVFESAIELYRKMQDRGLQLRKEGGRDDILYDELCNSIGCPDEQLASYLKQEDKSAEWFMREFLQLAAPFARMFSDIWKFLSDEQGTRATEDIRVRFGFEKEDVTEINLEEFREMAQTARQFWVDATIAYWSDDAFRELFSLAQCVNVEGSTQDAKYIPKEPYQLPTIDTYHDDDFEEIVRRVRDIFQYVIDGAAEIDEEEYSSDNIGSENHVEQSISTLLRNANLLHDLHPAWKQIFSNHYKVSEEDRRQAVDFYRENIAPKIEARSDIIARNQRTLLDILRLPFWENRWHVYEIWMTIQTLEALDSYDPQINIMDNRIQIDGGKTATVAELDVIRYDDACVVTELQTRFQTKNRTAIRPDLSICRTQDLDAESRAVIIEYKQRASLSSSHAEEVAQSYLSGSPEAVGLAMVNYDAVPDVEFPETAELLGNVRPGSSTVNEYREMVNDLMREAELFGHLDQKAVLIDVSGSMGNVYANPEIQDALQSLIEWREKGLNVYRFSDGLTEHPQITVSEVEAGLETGNGTDVTRAIQQVDQDSETPSILLVVTDGQDPLPDPVPEGIETIKQCSPRNLPSELGWLRKED